MAQQRLARALAGDRAAIKIIRKAAKAHAPAGEVPCLNLLARDAGHAGVARIARDLLVERGDGVLGTLQRLQKRAVAIKQQPRDVVQRIMAVALLQDRQQPLPRSWAAKPS